LKRSRNWKIKGESYLTIFLQEAQELVNKYAGTGEIRVKQNGELIIKKSLKLVRK